MIDRQTLLGLNDNPAELAGYGAVPPNSVEYWRLTRPQPGAGW
jgi:hypothetical protein